MSRPFNELELNADESEMAESAVTEDPIVEQGLRLVALLQGMASEVWYGTHFEKLSADFIEFDLSRIESSDDPRKQRIMEFVSQLEHFLVEKKYFDSVRTALTRSMQSGDRSLALVLCRRVGAINRWLRRLQVSASGNNQLAQVDGVVTPLVKQLESSLPNASENIDKPDLAGGLIAFNGVDIVVGDADLNGISGITPVVCAEQPLTADVQLTDTISNTLAVVKSPGGQLAVEVQLLSGGMPLVLAPHQGTSQTGHHTIFLRECEAYENLVPIQDVEGTHFAIDLLGLVGDAQKLGGVVALQVLAHLYQVYPLRSDIELRLMTRRGTSLSARIEIDSSSTTQTQLKRRMEQLQDALLGAYLWPESKMTFQGEAEMKLAAQRVLDARDRYLVLRLSSRDDGWVKTSGNAANGFVEQLNAVVGSEYQFGGHFVTPVQFERRVNSKGELLGEISAIRKGDHRQVPGRAMREKDENIISSHTQNETRSLNED